ncbi:sn-glycerol-1-phosphate dehydrogenase [Taklimakanibacter albus]|uniref:Sn-glycerol-1-phosphate dehydrogenase n=1 Tax=Taklimakanibacter albus TaxID=2800327 RepID=A0ACC5RDT6_9HYPH|nr:sn-glycerol-1-phosphate dehydrogenase [Aestuariivirga sp. YIM B02566]MBK1870808.1 sn-glycerol-1-phosphate dehydrogenase [Aestuariivirga sp. YIM B02566]
MFAPDKITQLLDGTYEDPDGLGKQRVDTRSLIIAPKLDGMERDLVKALDLGRHVAVVSDQTTHAILGQRVERALAGLCRVQSLVLPEAPHPDDETVSAIRKATTSADALIAIGSGTINDLCKYASAEDKKPYAVFATAPSMNGYTSVNAAITVHGHKKSLAAQAPRGAFFDLAILAAAPKRLIRSGLGDSLCRATSQADWLLAHLLLDQPYRRLPYALLKDDEAPLFAQSAALMAGDLAAMERLVRTLVLSGFGTAIHGNSQPASQGEHLISHYIDMLGDPARPLVYHGEQIGVTTLSMARLQQEMLKRPPRLGPDSETEASFTSRYGETLGPSCWADFAHKRLSAEKAEALNDHIARSWPDIADKIAAISLAPDHLEKVLKAAGAEITPEAIHLPRAFYDQALLRCREIRNRYTFLDLAANGGRLAPMLANL